jgi:cell fate regulator YaaT (PSP1 superfamily)
MSEKNKVIGVDCCFSGVILEIPEGAFKVVAGDKVIFKDEEGKEEFGIVRYRERPAVDEKRVLSDSKILRKATENDVQKWENYNERSGSALSACENLVKTHELEMQAFRASYSFDGNKVHFMFTADDRVDFRDLVKDLAKILKKQIYLRQVGPRDKAKIVGGFGKCGRSLCCKSFLPRLESVNMEMVRAQGLESKGSSKLSGVCGKLLCCLKYEVELYKELRSEFPSIESVLKLKKSATYPGASGRLVAIDVLNGKLKMILETGEFVVVEIKEMEKVVKKGGILTR